MAKRFKEKENKKTIITVLRIFFTLTLMISLIGIAKWFIDNNKSNIINEEISESITTVDSGYNIDFKTLKEKNADTVAWLKVNGTNIEYTVVKTDNNDFYLTHDFEKNYNNAGWIFADYENKFDGTDKNLVIYGHNRKDDSMFGSLSNILEADWYNNEENTKINFITENEKSIYEVFSIYKIENENYYITTDFTDSQFSKYIETIKQRSINDFQVEVTNQDNILTLSTCGSTSKYRVVLHAKKIDN